MAKLTSQIKIGSDSINHTKLSVTLHIRIPSNMYNWFHFTCLSRQCSGASHEQRAALSHCCQSVSALLTFTAGRVTAVEAGGQALALFGPHQQVAGLTVVRHARTDTELGAGQHRVGRLLRTAAGHRL